MAVKTAKKKSVSVKNLTPMGITKQEAFKQFKAEIITAIEETAEHERQTVEVLKLPVNARLASIKVVRDEQEYHVVLTRV